MANSTGGGTRSPNSSSTSDNANLGSALDLLRQMEGQVGHIAQNRPGQAAVNNAADEELNQLREELLTADQKGYEQLAAFVQALEDLKLSIPSLIDETVNTRFLELEEAFHRNVKEIHSRSIDAFTQSVQSKIGQRISALENNLSLHTEAMGQLREHYLKTDRNVQRLMSGLDRLTAELYRLSAGTSANIPRTVFSAPSARADRYERAERSNFEPRSMNMPGEVDEPSRDSSEAEDPEPVQRVRKRKRRGAPWVVIAVVALAVLVPSGLIVNGWIKNSGTPLASRAKAEAAPDAAAPLTGTAAQMRMAQDFVSEKNYARAESIYKLVLKSEPNNRDAIKELASVLFRQQKYEESAAILKTLPPE